MKSPDNSWLKTLIETVDLERNIRISTAEQSLE